MRWRSPIGVAMIVSVMAGCSGGDAPTADAMADTETSDTGLVDIAFADTGSVDGGPTDAGTPDVGRDADVDTGAADVGVLDAGSDVGTDTGEADGGRSDTGTDVSAPVDAGTTDVPAPPVDAGGRVLRRGSLGSLGPRPPRSVNGRITDDEFQSGGRMCAGSVCLTGGFLR